MLLNDGVGLDIHRVQFCVIGLEVCADNWECQIGKEFRQLEK
jgi:hypothetical protein